MNMACRVKEWHLRFRYQKYRGDAGRMKYQGSVNVPHLKQGQVSILSELLQIFHCRASFYQANHRRRAVQWKLAEQCLLTFQ